MSKLIQAYFRTEDEAEAARYSLQAYQTSDVEVGALESSLGRDKRLLIPIVPYNTTGSMTGGAVGGISAPGSTGPDSVSVVSTNDFKEARSRDDDRDDEVPSNPVLLDADDVYSSEHNDDLRYVLSVKVAESDYDQVVNKLRAGHAFIEKFD
ncbi:hypothetical protein [Paenibacillus massiliensis]|uniref:hypothetical protein n=1 Tax=Paenibacillus massiliensis TaxID=225917 RepID=UPI00035EF23F|nr:hypothetical protein [Paenibacillus massiliensis]